jgi:hypothetical protein
MGRLRQRRLYVWAERNLGAVLEARTAYDARVATSTAS